MNDNDNNSNNSDSKGGDTNNETSNLVAMSQDDKNNDNASTTSSASLSFHPDEVDDVFHEHGLNSGNRLGVGIGFQRAQSAEDSLTESQIFTNFRTNRRQQLERRMNRRSRRNIFNAMERSRRRMDASQRQWGPASLRDSIADFGMSVADVALDLKDALQDEALDVKDALLDELEQADRGASHFLQMSMTRTIALPPQQAEEAARQFQQAIGMKEIGEENDGPIDSDGIEAPLLEEQYVGVEICQARPWYAYPLLIAAVIALASVGPVSQLVSGTIPCLASLWRLIGTSLAMLPLALRVMTMKKRRSDNDDEDIDIDVQEDWIGWSWTSWLTAALGTFSYVTIGVSFGFAMKLTAIGNVLIFANSQSILLFLGKAIYSGGSISFVEALGVLVAASGALLCSQDSDRQRAEQLHDGNDDYRYQTLWGDGFALLAGVAGVLYLVAANALRDKVDILVYMPLNMMAGSGLVVGFMTLVLHEHISIGIDRHAGLFGWLTPTFDRLALELYIILGCSVFGTFGYIQAMRYFDNLTVSVACLMEPMIATVVAYSCGVGLLPGLVGWVGNALVVVGTVAVIYPSVQQPASKGEA